MMDNDVASVTLPTLDEHDVAAVEAMLIRAIRAQDQLVRDRDEIKAINLRIASNSKMRDGAYQALKVFGFVESPEEDVNLWDLVLQVIGSERYERSVAIARGEQFPTLLEKMGDEQPPTKAVSDGVLFGDSAEAVVMKRSVPIRAAILEYLGAMGDKGAKVGQVKQHLADAYGITVHEKTPGMTLYRLLKEGLVDREGRTWFVKAELETKENEAPTERTGDASETALAAL